jgi:hypothetical protein
MDGTVSGLFQMVAYFTNNTEPMMSPDVPRKLYFHLLHVHHDSYPDCGELAVHNRILTHNRRNRTHDDSIAHDHMKASE